MSVASILSVKGRKIAMIGADDSIDAAVQALKHHRIGALIVSKDGVGVDGILSERDIVRGLAENKSDLSEMRVSDLMTRKVKTCSLEDTVQEVMEFMTEGRFRHLPVIENGKLCGVISIGDVVKNRIAEVETEASAMRNYISSY